MDRRLIRRGALAGMTILGLETAYAILKPSPDLESHDPSAEFGNPSDPTVRVAVIGDSSVHAPGVDGPHQIWVSLICERLAQQGRHIVLRSFAVGGSKADDLLIDQMDEAIASAPDVILVSVGANDVLKGVPRATFKENLDRLISGLTKSTDATVILSGVGVLGTIPRLYPPLSHLISRRAESFDRAHREIAETYGTIVVDQRADDVRIWQTDRSLWAQDDFHVSPAGHARWAEMAWKTIGPVFDGQTQRS